MDGQEKLDRKGPIKNVPGLVFLAYLVFFYFQLIKVLL
jgi:hypothetical protein